MTIKSILCVFSGEVREYHALDMAMKLSNAYQTELTVMHILSPLVEHPEYFGRSEISQAIVGNARVLETLQEEAREQCEMAETQTHALASKNNLTVIQSDVRSFPGVSCVRFKVAKGDVRECLPREGRLSDIIILGHDGQSDDTGLILSALNSTGRPVMLVPSVGAGVNGQRVPLQTVAIAWDGSLGASRALHGSLSLMRLAKEVFAICVLEDRDLPDEIADQRLTDYMSLQGLSLQILHIRRDGKSVGEAIRHKAQRLGADVLVMGAYGYSHVSEAIFGGATRYMLAHSDIATVLSH